MKTVPRLLFGALLVASLVTFVTNAGAAPSAAERETARRFMDEGKEHMKQSDPLRAIEAYQKAHDIMRVPTTGFALARAHLAAGHLVEARDAALEVARIPREPGEPAVFDSARRQAEELEAQLTSRIPTLRLTIKGAVPTRVTVDGAAIAPSSVGAPIAMNPGKRRISVRGAGGSEATSEIELAERDAKELELSVLARTPSTKAAPTIRGFGNDDPGPRSGERTPSADALVYGGFGLGVAGVIAGSVTGAMTLAKASDITPRCEAGVCDPAAKNTLDSANTLATVSNVAFAVGAVGLAAGTIGLLLPKRSAPTSGAARHRRFAIHPTAGGIGGTF